MSGAAMPEPQPEKGKVVVADLVLQDIEDRVEFGVKKYGTKLKTFNGRNALWDAYQEALDLVMYLRQRIAEEQCQQDVHIANN